MKPNMKWQWGKHTPMNRILCVGDGFAHGHIWPEWPQILSALLPNHQTVTISGIGAGNEFLIHELLTCDPDQDIVIFQWAQANRFDKIIQDDQWQQLAQQDPVYGNNFYQISDHKWWLSSASQVKEVQQYHTFFVQSRQQQQRLHDQQRLLQGFLISTNCSLISTSTQEQQIFSLQSEFKHTRGQEVQPSPTVHMAYVEQKILPRLPLLVQAGRLARLRKAVCETEWKAYDADRTFKWQQIVKDLDTD